MTHPTTPAQIPSQGARSDAADYLPTPEALDTFQKDDLHCVRAAYFDPQDAARAHALLKNGLRVTVAESGSTTSIGGGAESAVANTLPPAQRDVKDSLSTTGEG